MATPTAAKPAAVEADFTTPIYMDEPSHALDHADPLGQPASTGISDPTDLNLLEFQVETNTDVNAYAAPPPIPDGRYRAKLKQIDVKLDNGGTARYKIAQKPTVNGGSPYVYTAIEATIIDPAGRYDGLKVWDRFVSTLPARNGGIPMVRVLTSLGHKLPASASPRHILEALLKVLGGEPELEIETVWEGNLDQADQERFKQAGVKPPRVLGMHRFPDNPEVKGAKLPDMDVDTSLGKVHLHAQVRINNYHPLKK
jgi:hypothetical protein